MPKTPAVFKFNPLTIWNHTQRARRDILMSRQFETGLKAYFYWWKLLLKSHSKYPLNKHNNNHPKQPLKVTFRPRRVIFQSPEERSESHFFFLGGGGGTFQWLHVMRAIWSVRPKCSHRCVSLKETSFKTCANPQAQNQKLSRANGYENEMV